MSARANTGITAEIAMTSPFHRRNPTERALLRSTTQRKKIGAALKTARISIHTPNPRIVNDRPAPARALGLQFIAAANDRVGACETGDAEHRHDHDPCQRVGRGLAEKTVAKAVDVVEKRIVARDHLRPRRQSIDGVE